VNDSQIKKVDGLDKVLENICALLCGLFIICVIVFLFTILAVWSEQPALTGMQAALKVIGLWNLEFSR